MNIKTYITLCAVFGIIAACSTGRNEHQPQAIKAGSPKVATEQPASTNQPIRLVDFANSTYPWPSDLGDPQKSFTLRDGELKETREGKGLGNEMGVILESIAYGDVTRDGAEEAMVVLSIVTGGSAIPHAVYIYTLRNSRVELLWALSTGDRANNGLRQVYADDGELVIERYNKNGLVGDCCPNIFTRIRYEWQGNRFQEKGKEETLPNPDGNGSSIMPRYRAL